MKLKQILFAGMIALIFASCTDKNKNQIENNNDLIQLRIGWQIPLATQGQLVSILKETNILAKHGIKAEFIPFSFGSPQVEAAKAGSLDLIFVGDQPAINLIASGGKWKIIGPLFETRVAIMVPPNSKIGSLKDASNGFVVASPFGSVAHRESVLAQNPYKTGNKFKNINVDILEIAELAKSNNGWGDIDAIVAWEPTVSLLTEAGYAKSIHETKTLGVYAASNDVVSNSDLLKKIDNSLREAWLYLLENTEQANTWYIDTTSLGYTKKFLRQALSFDRNGKYDLPLNIDLTFTKNDYASLENGARWAFEQGYIKSQLKASQLVHNVQKY